MKARKAPARAAKPRARNADWVVVGGKPGELAHCTRCGQGLDINLPQAVDVIVSACDAFGKVHAKCQPGQYAEPAATTPQQWLAGRDTGVSSAFIYTAPTGNSTLYRQHDVPHDPEDFGRCYRLLKLFPQYREALPRAAQLCPKWKPFVEAWDELTALYEAELTKGAAPKLYERIKQLGG